jgi:hypothetical protein
MEPIGFATLYTKPRRLEGQDNVSEVWVADALTHEGDVRLYVKKTSKEEIMAECLASLLAKSLGLPVAKAYIVTDPGDLLGGGVFAGSEDAGAPSIKQWLNLHDQTVLNMLAGWKKLHEVALFDEWIANPDRQGGNLLWGGGENWVLIDHAMALWSALGKPHADMPFQNILATLISDIEKDMGPARLRHLSGEFAGRCREIDHDLIINASQSQHIGMYERCEVTLSSLETRLSMLPALLSRHGNQADFLP